MKPTSRHAGAQLVRLALASQLALGCAARPAAPTVMTRSAAGDVEAAGAHAWRLAAPPVQAPTPTELPSPVTFVLDNGIAVVVQRQPRLPMFAAAMMFGGGSDSDPVGKEGLAAACLAAWLPETATVQGELLSALLADLGAGMAASAGDNYSLITLRGPEWNYPRAFELWQDVALPSTWDKERGLTLERAKLRLTLAARKLRANSELLAARIMRLALLGEAAAEARVPTEASLARITTQDCEAYQATYLRADQLTLIVAGDIRADALELALYYASEPNDRTSRFARMPIAPRRPASATTPAAAPARTVPAKPSPALAITLIDVPEASQAQLAIGQIGAPPSHAAYLPTLVAMQALGGAGGGRLVTKLRESTGFGYYAKYSATTGRAHSLLGLHASVEPGAAWLAATYILHERNKLARGVPVTDAELATIVANRTQLAYEAFATPQAWVMAYVQVARLGLDMDYFAQQVTELAMLTPSAVQAVMQALVGQPVELVIVGDAEAPQYAPALISGWNPRVVRMRGERAVTLRQALAAWAAASGATFREIAR